MATADVVALPAEEAGLWCYRVKQNGILRWPPGRFECAKGTVGKSLDMGDRSPR